MRFFLQSRNNLSDVANAPASLANIGGTGGNGCPVTMLVQAV